MRSFGLLFPFKLTIPVVHNRQRQRFINPELSNNSILARRFAEQTGATYGFEPDDELVFHYEVAVEMASGLLTRAFQLDKNGDSRFIEATRTLCGDYLRTNVPLPRS